MSNLSHPFYERISRLTQKIQPQQALLLSRPTDIAYFTGFEHLVPEERESFLLITPHQHLFCHTSFSPYSASSGIKTFPSSNLAHIKKRISEIHQKERIDTLLIDKKNLTIQEYETLTGLDFLEVAGLDRQLIWQLRTIKDRAEIETLTQAAEMTSQAMYFALDSLKAGMTEIGVREIIEQQLRELGSTQPAFPTIVAFGANSALPHHQPTKKILENEMAVLIDMGATVNGYHGDMTRTVWFGDTPHPEFATIQKVVKDAYQAALSLFAAKKDQPGRELSPIKAKDLDTAARQLIKKAGFGNEFIHTTGHGLGLDLHETLSLNWSNSQPILPGMVITIEPGIYLEGKFGYRYENTVVVTQDGVKRIT